VKLQVLDQQAIQGSESYISLRLSVVDTGIGMSEEGVKRLFIDFGRLAENENRNKSGTGLGLSICKQIIEKMGGSVDVKSQLDVGSQFIINLKLKCKTHQSKEQGSVESGVSNMHNFPFIFRNEGEEEYQNLMPNQINESQIFEQENEEEKHSEVLSNRSIQSNCCNKIDTLLKK